MTTVSVYSAVYATKKGSISLRTGVPGFVSNLWNLKAGDEIVWTLDTETNKITVSNCIKQERLHYLDIKQERL